MKPLTLLLRDQLEVKSIDAKAEVIASPSGLGFATTTALLNQEPQMTPKPLQLAGVAITARTQGTLIGRLLVAGAAAG